MIQPEAEELPQVIVGTCGCLLPTDTKPAGYRFVATPTGDKRVAVYACAAHNHAKAPQVSEAVRTPVRPPRGTRKAQRGNPKGL